MGDILIQVCEKCGCRYPGQAREGWLLDKYGDPCHVHGEKVIPCIQVPLSEYKGDNLVDLLTEKEKEIIRDEWACCAKTMRGAGKAPKKPANAEFKMPMGIRPIRSLRNPTPTT